MSDRRAPVSVPAARAGARASLQAAARASVQAGALACAPAFALAIALVAAAAAFAAFADAPRATVASGGAHAAAPAPTTLAPTTPAPTTPAQTTPAHAPPARARLVYPRARTVDQVDDYFGTKVADPYRWLENVDAPEARAWVEAEDSLTFGWLEAIPARRHLIDRVTTLWNYPRFTPPVKEGDRYFYSKNDGLQPQPILYVQESLAAEPRVLLDPNALSPDGTVAVSGQSISRDGRWLAWSSSVSGSDWQTWHVRDIATAQDLPDLIEWAKFTTAAWQRDGSGFFYGRFAEPKTGQALEETNYYQKLFFHKRGTPQRQDELVYSRPDRKEWGFAPQVSDDGRWLVVTVSQGTDRRTRIYVRDLADPAGTVRPLLDDFDAAYAYVGNDSTVFYFQTDLQAPQGRIIAVDAAAPGTSGQKREIVPQSRDVLSGVTLLNDEFVCVYMQDAHHVVRLYGRDGRPAGSVALPGLGSVAGFAGHRADRETFYAFTSFLDPTEIYHLDLGNGRSSLFRAPEFDFDFSKYETEQVFYTSKDGTRVPMFIVHRRGLQLDGGNPTLLYGYGGFDIAMLPSFSAGRLAWLELGGVWALANIRGGNEYGEEWHQQGMLDKKQNVFDDFIAAAEWLIAHKYTSTPKLAIEGASNGGLLVGACLTQRPDLYGAAIAEVGVMDMLRFQLFTIGWAWVSDYGSSDDPQQFKALYAYSPYHNIKPGVCYPPTLITTADHDDRVVPGHSFKFAARLQAAQGCDNPILIRVETKAGHGAGKPTSKLIEETADHWAFLVRALRMQ